MPPDRTRRLGPGIHRVVGDDPLQEIGEDEGIALLRPSSTQRHILVLHQGAPGTDALLAEADLLAWLDGRAPAPEVLASGRADDGDETLILRIDAEARPASVGHALEPERLVTALGDALRALHGLATATCPLDAGPAALRGEVRRRLDEGRLSVSDHGPYAGRAPEDLVALLDELSEGLTPTPAVVIHGRLRPDRVWFDPSGNATFTGWRWGGVGDRHADLAAVAALVQDLHGPALVGPLLDIYGLDDVDLRSLDVHQLLVHLLR